MKSNATHVKKRLEQGLIVVGVVIIPLAYSLLYLGAFWDPYSRLDHLPVAVVNEDAGAVVDNESRNLGNEMVERMKKDDSLEWVFTDEAQGRAGVDGNAYYAMILIPKDFSASIASAETINKRTALLTYVSNQKRNFLASQIFSKAVLLLEEQARADVNRDLTKELSYKLQDVPKKLTELSSGLDDMHAGASDLSDGIVQLKEGQDSLATGAVSLDQGLTDLLAGASDLNANMQQLDAGVKQASDGMQALTSGAAGIPALSCGIGDLDSGATDLKSGVNDYVAGVNELVDQSEQVAAALTDYVSRNPAASTDPVLGPLLAKLSHSASQLSELKRGGTTLKTGAAQVKDGADALKQNASSLSSLSTALAQLSGALTQLKGGSAQLYAGTQALKTGALTAKTGADDLVTGVKQLQQGAGELSGGSKELTNGIATAKSEVEDAIGDADEELQKTDGLDAFAAEPVSLTDATVNTIPNYGTAFAPYFMSLSLWVGALILLVGIYLDPDERMPLLSRASNRKALRTVVFALIGIVQAFALAFLVIVVLHLQVKNLMLFYGSCFLTSMVFLSIVYFLVVNFGNIGKFLSILFLVLQLTACGGTFPMETVPTFFNAIYRFMPMTYSVNLLKEAISGGSGHIATQNSLVLFGILLIFSGMTLGAAILRRHKAKPKLAPVE